MFEFMEECGAPPLSVSDAVPAQPVVIAPAIPAAAAGVQPQASSAGEGDEPEGVPLASPGDVRPQAPAGQGDASAPDSATAPATLGLTKAWREIIAAREEVERQDHRVRVLSNEAIGYSLTLISARHGIAEIEEMATQFRDGVFHRASKEFGVQGIELKIDQIPILEALGPRALWHTDPEDWRARSRRVTPLERLRRLSEDFDPDAIWAELTCRYGGEAGKEQAYRQVAARIASSLGLERKPPLERKGRLVLEVRAYTESTFGGGYGYTYDTRNYLNRLRGDLALFASCAGDDQTASELQHKKEPLLEANVPLEPRTKQQFGAMEWTFLKPKVQIAFSGDLGRSFRVFMARFGPRPDPRPVA